jgi:hypothetical protein
MFDLLEEKWEARKLFGKHAKSLQAFGIHLGRDIGLNVKEIPFRWISLKICILMYFEVLNNV